MEKSHVDRWGGRVGTRAVGVVSAVGLLAACFGTASHESPDGGAFDGASGSFDAGTHADAAHDAGSDAPMDATTDVEATIDATADGGPGSDGATETGAAEGGIEAGACNPLSTPDPTKGVFVSGASGSDTTGDGSIGSPFQTIGKGMLAAAAASSPRVYVAPGTYAESLTFPVSAAGIFVEGGWAVSGSTWTTDCNAGPSGRTVLQGSTTAVQAVGLTAPSGISTMTVQTSANVSTSSPGTSLLGVLVSGTSAPFTLAGVDVVTGSAGNGSPSPATPPATGHSCNNCQGAPSAGTTPAAGTPASAEGTFTAAGFTPADGQPGGPGTAGSDGTPAPAPQTITYNASCAGGCFSPCGTVTAQTTGAAGGCGCGGVGGAGGAAGHGGAASVAVLVYGAGATVTIQASTLAAGKGGDGAAGALGGAPTSGTSGTTGAQSCASSVTCGPVGFCAGGTFGSCGVQATSNPCAAGSTGGDGFAGGAGSAGGGGAGGPSYAVVTAGGATASVDGASSLSVGSGGAGAGGAPDGTAAPHGSF